jgi:serine/threonine protein kinase
MFCALGYLNRLGVAHRDVKPSNLLCDPETGVLKLGDFGSAKRLVRGEKSTSYQVTRYYRAPELLFESVHYTPDIGATLASIYGTRSLADIWAGACVLGELLIGNVMLPGRSKDDQTRIVIELFGYPSDEDCAAMHVARPRFARRPARGIRNVSFAHADRPECTARFSCSRTGRRWRRWSCWKTCCSTRRRGVCESPPSSTTASTTTCAPGLCASAPTAVRCRRSSSRPKSRRRLTPPRRRPTTPTSDGRQILIARQLLLQSFSVSHLLLAIGLKTIHAFPALFTYCTCRNSTYWHPRRSFSFEFSASLKPKHTSTVSDLEVGRKT